MGIHGANDVTHVSIHRIIASCDWIRPDTPSEDGVCCNRVYNIAVGCFTDGVVASACACNRGVDAICVKNTELAEFSDNLGVPICRNRFWIYENPPTGSGDGEWMFASVSIVDAAASGRQSLSEFGAVFDTARHASDLYIIQFFCHAYVKERGSNETYQYPSFFFKQAHDIMS